MSFEAKASLLNGLERQLSEVVTASEMSKVLSVVSNVLALYDVHQIAISSNESDDLLDAFISAMQIQGRSQLTIERYKSAILRMMKEINVSTREITVYHLRTYLSREKERGLSDRTLEGLRQIMSSYFNWLQRENLIQVNPVANLGTIRYQKKLKTTYSEVDIEKLKLLCGNKRDRAIISFLNSTGCRISEMVNLDRSDVDLNALECTVLGKGNKERTVYLSPIAGLAIGDYLAERADDLPALFVGRGSKRLTPCGVRYMLNNLAKKAGVEHVHPHKFRRTLATDLIRHGMPIQEVAAILGHDKLDTTMQYVVLDKTDTKNAYRRYA